MKDFDAIVEQILRDTPCYTQEQLDELNKKGLASMGAAALLTFPTFSYYASTSKGGPDVENIAISENLITALTNRILPEEGFSATVYKDVYGIPTIGYGHKILPNEDFSDGITKQRAIDLFKQDIVFKINIARSLFPALDSYPIPLQVALIDGVYRGEHKRNYKTTQLINAGKWEEAAKEYLNNREYLKAKQTGSGVAKRMERNSAAMAQYGSSQPTQVASLNVRESLQRLKIKKMKSGLNYKPRTPKSRARFQTTGYTPKGQNPVGGIGGGSDQGVQNVGSTWSEDTSWSTGKAFSDFFNQNIQKQKIQQKKRGKVRYKKPPFQRIKRTSSTYYDPGIYNQANVIDTAHTSSQSFVTKG